MWSVAAPCLQERKKEKKMSSSFFSREPYFLPPFLAPAFSPAFSFGLGASFGLASGFFAIVRLTSETRAKRNWRNSEFADNTVLAQ
jgi:hypothetical protein